MKKLTLLLVFSTALASGAGPLGREAGPLQGLAAAQTSSTAVAVKQLAAPASALSGNWQVVVVNGVFTVIPYVAPAPVNFVDGKPTTSPPPCRRSR